MSSQILNLSTDSFDQYVSKDSNIVLLDIWAEWCGPCKQLSPILDEVAELYLDEVKVYKVNADQNQDITEKLKVRGLPTLLVMVNGEEKERILGLTSKTRICQVLDQHLEG
ncbi:MULTISPECIES: thioredoxin [Acinetobacter]|uniref:Thioredoxin n=1 Tax=Acinetobacter populi TaxID=1582270 RepID=A0A1Z9YUH9_9GAMM|nr:thioredoxin [Acinetobacter populi]MCH4248062.1 thioredoxin [Acinetobacter populi]OUY05886.1 thioredoxin [Acinetobacter populi]